MPTVSETSNPSPPAPAVPEVAIIGQDHYGGTREPLSEKESSENAAWANLYWSNIPEADLVVCRTKPLEYSDSEMKWLLARNRHANRICNLWGRGCTNGTRLKVSACETCHLTFWCSSECRAKDIDKHRCRQNVLDHGPLGIVFAPLAS